MTNEGVRPAGVGGNMGGFRESLPAAEGRSGERRDDWVQIVVAVFGGGNQDATDDITRFMWGFVISDIRYDPWFFGNRYK